MLRLKPDVPNLGTRAIRGTYHEPNTPHSLSAGLIHRTLELLADLFHDTVVGFQATWGTHKATVTYLSVVGLKYGPPIWALSCLSLPCLGGFRSMGPFLWCITCT